jgi:chromosome partitioning protein
MFDSRTRLARQVVEDISHRYGINVLDPPIPKTVRVAEAPGRGMSVLQYARRSGAADAYRALVGSLERL